MNPSPFQLDRYFFPRQEVTANPSHHVNLPSNTASVVKVAIGKDATAPNVLTVVCHVSLDEAASTNPSYFFTLEAFGIFRTPDVLTDDATRMDIGMKAAPILIGAARERLAELTSRAPWGPLILGITQISQAVDSQPTLVASD